MKIAKCLYICLLIGIVHCHSNANNTNVSNNTIHNGTEDISNDKSRVSEKDNQDINNSTINNQNGNAMIDGKPRHHHSQIDVPFKNDTLNNHTKHFVLVEKRQAVLIINGQMSRQNQRQKKSKKGKPNKAESLLYEEYDDHGSLVYSYTMSNLDDVALFFDSYLETKICHGTCEPLAE